jgi:homoserine kinase
VEGEGAADLPRDERHLVATAARAATEAMNAGLPGLRLRCTNRIPQARGLGSSAAAIVAGVLAARGLIEDGVRRLDDEATLALAARLDGHPDNVAACLWGGLTLAWRADGQDHAVRLEPSADVAPVVFVPPYTSSTAQTRGLLPATVSHADAAHTAGRAALLVHALTTAPALLMVATDDRLHQPYRAPAMPESAKLVTRLREAGLPAVISGAGPSVLVFLPAGEASGDRIEDWAPPRWTIARLAIDQAGARATQGT